jgi:hypothetical protein
MKISESVVTGVVAKKDGKYWGIQYDDGKITEYGYGPIGRAVMNDPEFVKRPEDMTFQSDPAFLEQLRGATLTLVKVTTVYEEVAE